MKVKAHLTFEPDILEIARIRAKELGISLSAYLAVLVSEAEKKAKEEKRSKNSLILKELK